MRKARRKKPEFGILSFGSESFWGSARMSEFYILAIDQGTTSSRAIVYDDKFQVVGLGQQEFPQYFPRADWVEHDLEEIWNSVKASIGEATKKATSQGFSFERLRSIGITNQRETFGFWDPHSGKPHGRAVVWQCRRSSDLCRKWSKNPKVKKFVQQSGLVLDPYFSGTKVRWMVDHDAALKSELRSGKAVFGTIDTFLVSRLSANKSHVTDASNASRTLMMNLKTQKWNLEAARFFGLSQENLPTILDSNAKFAETDGGLGFLPGGIPIHGVLGDQQAALFGQGCFARGQGKITYGTGAFALINTGSRAQKSRAGVSTIAWSMNGKTSFAVEGSVFIAGAAVQWLRDGLGLIRLSGEIEALARSVDSSEGVFFLPALSGLGAPYWVPEARGILGGLTRASTKAHVARATLEGIAGSVGALYEQLLKDAGMSRGAGVGVDGGACRNDLLMQFQSDLLQEKLLRPRDVETTARGAAMMAALGAGLLPQGLRGLQGLNVIDKEFRPQRNRAWAKAQKAKVEKIAKAALLTVGL